METEKCPICRQENSGLNLEETNGWYICLKCKTEVNTRFDLLFKEKRPTFVKKAGSNIN